MTKFYSLGRVGELDIWGRVARGALPASAVDAERTRAMVALGSYPDALLEFVAYGNEDAVYGEVAQAEIRRRRLLAAPP